MHQIKLIAHMILNVTFDIVFCTLSTVFKILDFDVHMHRGNLKFLILCVGIFPLLLTVYNIGKCNLTKDEDTEYRYILF